MTENDDMVVLGEFTSPHGVRGLLRVRCFTEVPEDLLAYGALLDARGREVKLTLKGPAKAGLLVAVDGVTDRDTAQALRGQQLFVPRSALPVTDDENEEFYHSDLIGLRAEFADGRVYGVVKSVQDFGAGVMLELVGEDASNSQYLPFTREMVPQVDLTAKRIVIAPLAGMLDLE